MRRIPRVPGAEPEIPRREIELFVVLRVVRDVHLPVLAEVAAVGVDDGGRIVVEPFGPLLEQRGDQDHPELPGKASTAARGGAGNRFGEAEILGDPHSGRNRARGRAPGYR